MSISSFIESRSNITWYIFAPHLLFPLRNGADIYTEGISRGISMHFPVVLISADAVSSYAGGQLTGRKHTGAKYRSKMAATCLAIIRGESYQLHKFNTPQYRSLVKSLKIQSHDTLVYSYTSTALLSKNFGSHKGQQLILTHNFDINFFANIAKGLRNPISKWAMKVSVKHINAWLHQNQQNFIFCHINEADSDSYQIHFPSMRNVVLKMGIDLMESDRMVALRQSMKTPEQKIILGFAGYLNGYQNLEALEFFADNFWPQLQQNFGKDKIEFHVIGSSPSLQVRKMAQALGWILLPDLPEDEFKKAIARCHYSVLPFPFTSGTKLKLFSSVALGVPFLATQCLEHQAPTTPASCLFCDSPTEWSNHLNHTISQIYNSETIQSLHTWASNFTWQTVCQQFLKDLELMPKADY